MKGQSALEFMLLVGFVMFMFVALYGVLNMQLSDRAQQGIYESLLDRSQAVQDEIALAHAISASTVWAESSPDTAFPIYGETAK